MPLSREEFLARVKGAEDSRAAEPWGIGKRVGSATRAAWGFVASGGATVSREEFEKRRALCQSCPHWNGRRCAICGCLAMKLYLPAERCPMGKWEAVSVPTLAGR
jgi:hypothetical protein